MVKFRNGSQIKTFKVMKKVPKSDSKARITYGDYEEVELVKGCFVDTSQKEEEKYNQMQHPISHKILVRGKTNADVECLLLLDNRKFYVQGKEAIGGLDIFSVLFCEEKKGF